MKSTHLVVFFTRGVSLHTWAEVGSLEREVAVYRRLQERGMRVTFVTYGDQRDLHYSSTVPGVRILCNRWKLPQRIYQRLVPILHARWLRSADVFKTNQSNGAEIALRAARLWRKPLIARCGYMWSFTAAQQFGADSPQALYALASENKVFSSAQRVVVTTQRMADDIGQRLPAVRDRIRVIPNYVDTEQFRAVETGAPSPTDVIYIGRLHPEKNVDALVEAVAESGVTAYIVGQGPLEQELKDRYGDASGRIAWLDRVPNTELPVYFARAKLFVLPSHYEGHPKTLIEAMACGKAVIGANVPGIQEIIQHGDNGWLCDVSPDSIRSAIQTLLSQPELCAQLGNNAREYALQHFALHNVEQMELSVIKEVMESRRG